MPRHRSDPATTAACHPSISPCCELTNYITREKGGANESHDGEDEGQDDAQLIAEVNAATGGELEHAAGSFGDEELDGSESNEFVGATDDPGDDELPDQAVSTESSSPVTQTSPGEAVPAVLGSIATSNGLVDARFGDLFPSDDDDEDGDEAGDMADGGQGSPQSTEPSTIHAESMMDTPSGGGATTDARRNSGRPSTPKQTRAR
ncbi:hypothetical protein L914_04086 [Phytophthora nicotianae]|nr:hypothetical protein L914_04086 [Phytophthora nicotianae]